MSDEENKGGKVLQRVGDLVGLLAGLGVAYAAFLVFTNKLPKTVPAQATQFFAYFYVLLFVGFIGLLGEQLGVLALVFLLGPGLILVTGVFIFKPEKWPFELYQDYYFFSVVIVCGLSIYLFSKLETTKKMKGVDKNLTGRVDPHAAARYRAEQVAKTGAPGDAVDGALAAKGERTLKKKKEAEVVSKVDPNETPEQRMEREMRELKDEFQRRSIKLSTTLIRVKNLAHSLDRDEIFSTIVELIAKGLDGDRVQLLLNDEEKKQLKVVRAEGMPAKEYRELVIPHEEGSMIGFMVRGGGSVKGVEGGALGAKECSTDPQLKTLVGQGAIKTIICAPILIDKKLFGVVNIEKMKNPDYTRDDLTLVATTCEVAGLVMKNAHLLAATVDDLASTKKLSEEQLQKNAQLSSSLSRIVSPSVAKMIMSDPSGLRLGGSKGIVTCYFSDIRGFTKMSEGMDPETLVAQLNVYFTRMTDILMELEGTLDKYVGDELMALFGAPVARPDDALRATLCGVRHQLAVKELQEQWRKEGKPLINIGIGINTGEVTAGYLGSEKQLSYTVIGDNVNLAARIMANAKPGQVLLSRSTYELVKDYFVVEALEPIMVKGKSMQIEIFDVKSVKDGVDFGALMAQAKEIGSQSLTAAPTAAAAPSRASKTSSATADLGVDLTKQNVVVDDKPKVVECSNCGTENDAQTKFCGKCGMPIF